MNKKITIFVGAFLLILITLFYILSNLFIITGPYEGIILDPVDEEPLQDVEVTFVADKFCSFALDTCLEELCLEELRKEITTTDSKGYYYFPKKIVFASSLYSERLNFNFKEKYFNHTKFYSESPFNNNNQVPSKEFISFDFKPKSKEIFYPILKVDSLSTCESILDGEARKKCILMNAFDVAMSSKNRSFCNLTWDSGLKNICLNSLDPNNVIYESCNCLERYGLASDEGIVKGNIQILRHPGLHQITNHEDLCISYCSWKMPNKPPLCDNIINKTYRNICFEAHVQEHIRDYCKESNYPEINSDCKFLKENIK